MQQGDTISAVATAPGAAGIGVIRLSGEHALAVAEQIFQPAHKTPLRERPNQSMTYGHIVDGGGKTVDEVMVLVMRAPHSYTCEDVVEIQAHGSAQALRKILRLTWQHGARQAEPGEFTKRAFLNGRLDLAEAQAVMDIIEARSERSLQMAEGHLNGAFSARIRGLRDGILDMTSQIEALIDFPEDGVEDVETPEIDEKIARLQEDIAGLLKTAHTGRILRDGLLTAIIGKPNVGKSSLLNALLREERAIVTDIPGTTRDSIEEYANIAGVPLRIIDTAGIRETDDKVERIGVEKARDYVDRASLVLALFDAGRPLGEEDREILQLIAGKDAILLLNKSDLTPVTTVSALKEAANDKGAAVIPLSTVTGEGLDDLAAAIHERAWQGSKEGEEEGFVNDERQAEILRQASAHLTAARETILEDMGLDCVSIDLRSAWEKLGELTGDTVGDELIDTIFSRFCIGK